MAGGTLDLLACSNFGQSLSGPVRFCPECGRPMAATPVVVAPQKKSRGCSCYLGVVAAGFIALMALGYFIDQVELVTKPALSPTEQAEKQKQQATLVVAAEGAKRLRDAMRNPDSFRPAQALIMNDQAVRYEFRSQNGFGGFNVGHAVLSPSGELKTNETSGFYALWDRECADKKGADKTWEVGYAAGFHGVFSDK